MQVYQIICALAPLTSTLRSLTIHNGSMSGGPRVTLKSFGALQTLRLCQTTLRSAFIRPGRPFRLSHVLPASLKCLILAEFDGAFFPLLRDLAVDLGSGGLPQLRQIHVSVREFLYSDAPAPAPRVPRAARQVALERFHVLLRQAFSPYGVAVEIWEGLETA